MLKPGTAAHKNDGGAPAAAAARPRRATQRLRRMDRSLDDSTTLFDEGLSVLNWQVEYFTFHRTEYNGGGMFLSNHIFLLAHE